MERIQEVLLADAVGDRLNGGVLQVVLRGAGKSKDHHVFWGGDQQDIISCLRKAVRPGDEVVDVQCGTGLIGFAALAYGAKKAWFLDISQQALECAMATATLNGFTKEECTMLPSDMFESLLPEQEASLDLIVMNPAEIPGPPELAVAYLRYGGEDGADFHCRLPLEGGKFLKKGGKIVFGIIGIANPDRVFRAYADAGFTLELLQEQMLDFTPEDFDSIVPGVEAFKWIQQQKAEGKAKFEESNDGTFQMWQKYFIATLDQDVTAP